MENFGSFPEIFTKIKKFILKLFSSFLKFCFFFEVKKKEINTGDVIFTLFLKSFSSIINGEFYSLV